MKVSLTTFCLALLVLFLPAPAAAATPLADSLARRVHHIGVRALDAVEASPSQRRSVEAAASRLAASLRTLQSEALSLGSDMREVWTGPTVAPGDVEDLRARSVDLLGVASQPVAAFVVETGQVLTQDQRRALASAAAAEVRRLSRRLR